MSGNNLEAFDDSPFTHLVASWVGALLLRRRSEEVGRDNRHRSCRHQQRLPLLEILFRCQPAASKPKTLAPCKVARRHHQVPLRRRLRSAPDTRRSEAAAERVGARAAAEAAKGSNRTLLMCASTHPAYCCGYVQTPKQCTLAQAHQEHRQFRTYDGECCTCIIYTRIYAIICLGCLVLSDDSDAGTGGRGAA